MGRAPALFIIVHFHTKRNIFAIFSKSNDIQLWFLEMNETELNE